MKIFLFIVVAIFCSAEIVASQEILWRNNGIPIAKKQGEQRYHTSVKDGYGGAIFAWQDSRNGNEDIYISKVDSNGAALWGHSGVPVVSDLWDQWAPKITTDGKGGAIIAYINYDGNIRAQRIDSGGNVVWGENGVLVTTFGGGWSVEKSKYIASDGLGGELFCGGGGQQNIRSEN